MALLLSRCERVWHREGATIARSLQPGLSDAEMDLLTAPLGLGLPEELRGWWGLHNGATWDNGGSPYTFNRGRYDPLEDAVAGTQIHRSVSADLRADFEAAGFPVYQPTFLTVMTLPSCYVVCDCGDVDFAPVYCYWPEEAWRLRQPVLPRFADLLLWWLEAHQAGAYESKDENGRQHLIRIKDVEDERMASGLM